MWIGVCLAQKKGDKSSNTATAATTNNNNKQGQTMCKGAGTVCKACIKNCGYLWVEFVTNQSRLAGVRLSRYTGVHRGTLQILRCARVQGVHKISYKTHVYRALDAGICSIDLKSSDMFLFERVAPFAGPVNIVTVDVFPGTQVKCTQSLLPVLKGDDSGDAMRQLQLISDRVDSAELVVGPARLGGELTVTPLRRTLVFASKRRK